MVQGVRYVSVGIGAVMIWKTWKKWNDEADVHALVDDRREKNLEKNDQDNGDDCGILRKVANTQPRSPSSYELLWTTVTIVSYCELLWTIGVLLSGWWLDSPRLRSPCSTWIRSAAGRLARIGRSTAALRGSAGTRRGWRFRATSGPVPGTCWEGDQKWR